MGRKLTRRRFMVYKLFTKGYTLSECAEAVAQAAAGHPEWDMDEEKTWEQWNAG